MARKLKCMDCHQKFDEIPQLFSHIEREHEHLIPEGWSVGRYYRLRNFGQAKGRCIECGKETPFNEASLKYKRYCGSKACKERYIRKRNERMMKVHNTTNMLNNPDHQKKMLAGRSISGEYTWSDGTKKLYVGTFELAGLEYLDEQGFSSDDVISPSPNVYHYEHEGMDRFYIPDAFIVSLQCELEFKDGGNNPNTHPKIMAVDKVKEKLKDEIMKNNKKVHYIKVVNKEHEPFLDAINEIKKLSLTKETERVKIFALGDDITQINNGIVMEGVSADEPVDLSAVLEGLGINPDMTILGR